jgi:hypothetical protein
LTSGSALSAVCGVYNVNINEIFFNFEIIYAFST